MIGTTDAIKMTTQIIITCSEILDEVIENYIRTEIPGSDTYTIICELESNNNQVLDELYRLDVIGDTPYKMAKEWLLNIITEAKSHVWGCR